MRLGRAVRGAGAAVEATVIWRGVCAVCGEPVLGASDDGTLDLPAGDEAVVHLMCLCFRGAGATLADEELIFPAVRAGFENASSGVGQ